ncbi:MAG: c-type cytochrome biogenesis protein CcsB [Syntrophorhabdaceae bacterium]|nr:c-type cytochrome biogenesis protein CcsB [Syntrophorhabdaceae bacterium]
MDTRILLGAFIVYSLSTFFYLLNLTSERKNSYGRIAHFLLLSAFIIHIMSVVARYFIAGYTPITNSHEALSFFSLCIAGFFLYVKKIYKVEILGAVILPVVLVILIFATAMPSDIRPLPPVLNSYWLPIHTIFSFIGNAIFLVSFFISITYLIVEKGLKEKRFSFSIMRFPSLEVLDSINYRCMSYGFIFLTIGIITGSIWASNAWGAYWSWDPKETWSLITWIIYAVLIHNRMAIGWRGRKTAYMMILGFFSMLVMFFGVNFLLGGLHSYM